MVWPVADERGFSYSRSVLDDTCVRLRFAKRGDRRFLSHLDLLRVIERALRRAAVPVRFSEGFHPRPRVSVPFALPLGVEAAREILEIRLASAWDPSRLVESLRKVLPAGLEIRDAQRVESFRKPRRIHATYRIESRGETLPAVQRWREIAGSGVVANKELVRGIHAEEGGILLEADLVDGRGVRPAEFLRALGLDPARLRVIRLDLAWEEGAGGGDGPDRSGGAWVG